MTPQTVETLMEDIEREDPLDFGLLSIDEHDARHLMANHFCEVNSALAKHGLEKHRVVFPASSHTPRSARLPLF